MKKRSILILMQAVFIIALSLQVCQAADQPQPKLELKLHDTNDVILQKEKKITPQQRAEAAKRKKAANQNMPSAPAIQPPAQTK